MTAARSLVLALHWQAARDALPLDCDCARGDICAPHERLVDALAKAWRAGIDAAAAAMDRRHERCRTVALRAEGPQSNEEWAGLAATWRQAAEAVRQVPTNLALDAQARAWSAR